MATEIAVSSAISFFQSAKTAGGQPLNVAFSAKSETTDIAADATTFSTQLTSQINQSYGLDSDSTTVTLDEFTRFASGDRIQKFSDISDSATRDLVKEAFDSITGGNKSQATAGAFAEFLRVQDSKDGKTDGHAIINFLI